jgi:hypothetical protein
VSEARVVTFVPIVPIGLRETLIQRKPAGSSLVPAGVTLPMPDEEYRGR